MQSLPNIVFIQPNFYIHKDYDYKRTSPNLVVAYLSAFIKQNINCNIHYIDSFAEGYKNFIEVDNNYQLVGLSIDTLKTRLEEIEPTVVCILNHFTAQFPSVLILTKLIKQWNRSIITIIGGAHPTGDFKNVLKEESIDFIFLGEAEKNIVNFLLYLVGQKSISELNGIISRHFKNRIIGLKKVFQNMDELPDPDFSIFNSKLYPPDLYHTGRFEGRQAIDYIFSRGCPYQCEYCCSNIKYGNKVRRFPIERIKKHFTQLKKLKYDEIMLMDDNILTDQEFAIQIMEDLYNKKFFWNIIGGIDRSLCSERIIEAIINYKCSRVHFSFETQNENIISKYQKKKSFKSFKNICNYIKILASNGIEVFVDFMIGFPEEGISNIKQTIKAAKILKDYGMGFGIFHCVTPFPGTVFHKRCIQNGYITEFDYRKYSFSQGVISTANFTADQITKIRQEAMYEVNGEELFNLSRKVMNRPNLKKNINIDNNTPILQKI